LAPRRVLLLDRRLRNRPRKQRQDPVDAIADFLRGDIGVLFEPERDDDLRDAFSGIRTELVDAADRVDRFLDLVGDLALHLLGRRARQTRGHGDGWKVHLRQSIDAELAEREHADDDQREDQDGRKDRTNASSANHCMAFFIRPNAQCLLNEQSPECRRPGSRRWWCDVLSALSPLYPTRSPAG
jgi:hypothetical protein